MPRPTPIHAPRDSTPAPLFGVFVLLWLAFGAALVVNQGALDTAWAWLVALPLVCTLAVWVFLFPITAALWIWQTDLALALRLAIIFALAIGTLATFGPHPGAPRRHSGPRPTGRHTWDTGRS